MHNIFFGLQLHKSPKSSDQAQGHQHSNRRRQCQVERRGEMPNVEETAHTLRNFRTRRGTRAAQGPIGSLRQTRIGPTVPSSEKLGRGSRFRDAARGKTCSAVVSAEQAEERLDRAAPDRRCKASHGVDALRGLTARTGLRITVGKAFVTVELRQLWKRHEFR